MRPLLAHGEPDIKQNAKSDGWIGNSNDREMGAWHRRAQVRHIIQSSRDLQKRRMPARGW
jgi:hypothetical protein